MFTVEPAKEINKNHVYEKQLIIHSLNVSYTMGTMVQHFGESKEHCEAIGYLHDFDYQKYQEEHLQHTEKELLEAGVDGEDLHIILSHVYGIVNDLEPATDMEKWLFTVDELTGIIQTCERMWPNGITDLEVKSFMDKFKDKKFASKCNLETKKKGCLMLGMDVKDVAEICIESMKPNAEEIGLLGTSEG